MELWNGVGQVANIAQLTGVGAYGLTSLIVEATKTVKRNQETCQLLARREKNGMVWVRWVANKNGNALKWRCCALTIFLKIGLPCRKLLPCLTAFRLCSPCNFRRINHIEDVVTI
jgi:hypothetical protein